MTGRQGRRRKRIVETEKFLNVLEKDGVDPWTDREKNKYHMESRRESTFCIQQNEGKHI